MTSAWLWRDHGAAHTYTMKREGGSMKIIGSGCLLALLAVWGVVAAQAPSSAAAEKAVAALENTWLQSTKTNNPDLIAPHLADKFVTTDPEGKVFNKDQSLAKERTRKYSSADYENVHVTVFGASAIATGGFRGKGTDTSGKPFEEHAQWTDTWVKMPDGKWQCVASQATAIKM
jgi:ketosteroid isomerase-like protein